MIWYTPDGKELLSFMNIGMLENMFLSYDILLACSA